MEIILHGNTLLVHECGKVEVLGRWAPNKGIFYEKKCGLTNNGYLRLRLDNKGHKQYLVHRIVAFAHGLITDIDAPILIDHHDRNPLNNKLENLRTATHRENMRNTNAKGYSFNIARQKYQAYITLDGKRIHLGLFILEEDAHQAYLDARILYFEEFA
tara:strand:+ start:1764 stop:2237 length:474 start_codon:yes stop_codon:yes gene_type:complete